LSTPQETVDQALSLSKADGCVVIADELSSANLRWANNTLTTNGVSRMRLLTVITAIEGVSGTAAGVVQRSGIGDQAVEDLVRAAEEAARANTAAEDAQPLVVGFAAPDWDAAPGSTSTAAFRALIPGLAEALARARRENRVLFGYAEDEVRTTYVGSSTGLRLRWEQPTGHVEINAKSPDYTRSAWVGVTSTDFADIDVTALDAELVRRLGWANRPVDLAAGRYETLLPPGALADLMIYLYWSAGARDAHDGRTVFSRAGGGTRIGDRLSARRLNLRSDPYAPGLECAPFVVARASGGTYSVFDNGLPLSPTAWIADGELRSLVQTRHSASLTNVPLTPAIDNLILEATPDRASMDDMVAASRRTLLLTCLWYIREVDPQTLLLTGLTRDGVYLVEGGEVVGAVSNFRFNESPVDLLHRITEVGPVTRTLPREWRENFTRVAMPPVRVAEFNMSTVSPAR